MSKRLAAYRRKRDFSTTPEPVAQRATARKKSAEALHFVVQLHHASHRHFDFRLEWGGTLRSWAVPKGPSRDPEIKRLAIEVEDHPLDYAAFEGDIPKGHYGAGHVDIWDEGTWEPESSAEAALRKGHLDFFLHGARLHGRWTLIRTRMAGKKQQWLLMKDNDAFVEQGDVADDTPLSQWLADRGENPPSSLRTPMRNGARKTATGKKSRGKAAMPEWFDLQLAKLHEHAPPGEDWLHEVKYDGYRLLALRDGKSVRLLSRNQLDWTARLPHAVGALRALDCDQCALDGELVVFDAQGHTRFDLLQQEFSRKIADTTRLVVFDMLWRDGEDLRERPLHERKQSLSQLIVEPRGKTASALQLADYLQGDGPLAFRESCKAGLEGIISKAVDAPYRDGRTDAWRKCKCVDSDEFVILGYNRGKGAREALGALLLGEPGEDGAWRYVGRVGTGFDDAILRDLKRKLKMRKQAPKLDNPPGAKQLRGARPIWVEPTLIAEIEHRGRTGDKLLRQASFKGLRPDKDIEDLMPQAKSKSKPRSSTAGKAVKKTTAATRKRSSKNTPGEIVLTHPDRVLIDKPRVTKQELAVYYRSIADHMLPGLVDRPLATVRCPEGIGKECFFQKHAMAGMPASLRVVELRNKRGGREGHLYVEDIEGVIGLVQMNVIEIHPWGSTVDDIDHPNRLVFDLDPAPGVRWADVAAGARVVRERLDAVGLRSFLRTTGGKGLHVVVPLNPRPDWDTAKAFAQALARTLAAEAPDKYLSVATKSKRPGRIFIDYLRNARGATAVASYCVRARRGAGVATPLRWEELSKLRSGDQYTIENIPARLKRMKTDPWAGIDTLKQALPKTRSR